MKKQGNALLAIFTVAFFAFTLGLYLGRNQLSDAVIVSVPPSMQTVPAETTVPEEETVTTQPPVRFPIDISCADKEELMALPGIGEVLAQRILDYRSKTGFSSVEDLLYVEGIGKKRFEEIYELITIGG